VLFFPYRWNPDAIVFSSNQVYGTPSYWVQFMFRESNGATLLKSQLQTPHPNSVAASAIICKNSQTYLKIKVMLNHELSKMHWFIIEYK